MNKAYLIYVERDGLGLSNKLRALCLGFEELGFKAHSAVAQTSGGVFSRLLAMARCCVLIARARLQTTTPVVLLRYSYILLPVYIVGRLLGIKYSLEVNSRTPKEFQSNKQSVRGALDRWVTGIALSGAKSVQSASNEVLEALRDQYPETHYVYNPNFVVDAHYRRDQLPALSAEGSIRFLFLGDATQPWQGIELFVERFLLDGNETGHTCELHIVGKSNQALERLAGERDPNLRVCCHGFLSGEDKYQLIASMHIGLGPMNLSAKGMQETSSIKTCEYLYAGLPIIIGYQDDSLPDNEPYILTLSLGDAAAERSRFSRFVAAVISSPEYREMAHEFAASNLTARNYVKRILATYEANA